VREVALQEWGDDPRVVRLVEEPAGHVEELADADGLTVRDPPGQPVLDRVGEGEPALADELEDDRRDEGLVMLPIRKRSVARVGLPALRSA
jgi:hypothetical protein